eukprot:359706-Chlamydomonas_euryale.AAC.2
MWRRIGLTTLHCTGRHLESDYQEGRHAEGCRRQIRHHYRRAAVDAADAPGLPACCGRVFALERNACASRSNTRAPPPTHTHAHLPAVLAGGHIFYPGYDDQMVKTGCPVHEDMTWRVTQKAAGPVFQNTTPPCKREGLLWEWFRKLEADDWSLDANGYTTSFRMHAKKGKTVEDLREVILTKPDGLSCTWNLGAADFYPSTSGKVEAAK